jgi:hypothetical protein
LLEGLSAGESGKETGEGIPAGFIFKPYFVGFRYANHMERLAKGRIVASNYDAKESGSLTRVVVFWDKEPV